MRALLLSNATTNHPSSSSAHIPISPNESPSMTISGRTWNGEEVCPGLLLCAASRRIGRILAKFPLRVSRLNIHF
jgi:hypothetical protein